MYRRAKKKLLKWFDIDDMNGYKTIFNRKGKMYAIYVVKADDNDGLNSELKSLNRSIDKKR